MSVALLRVIVSSHARDRADERGLREGIEKLVRDGVDAGRFSKKVPRWAAGGPRGKAWKGHRERQRYVWNEDRSWIAACKVEGDTYVVVTVYPPRRVRGRAPLPCSE